MPLPPGTRLGHYEIRDPLGAGGMGEVYRATDTRLGRDVAIKILPDSLAGDPDRMARFAREAQLLASLNHPNIAAIYGIEERAIVMELIDGPNLSGPLPLADALAVSRQIADALDYAHEKGVIHRDLKPANIKLTADGRVKVLDFGLAKALSNDPSAPGDPASSPTLTMRATLAGTILGTAAYMSPEQARGAPADRRADIWAFGVILYELLTGRSTFAGDTISDTLASVLKTDPDWSALPSSTPPAIRRLLRRCLERDRKRRLSDIADARLEIDEALSPASESLPPAPPPAPTSTALRWWNLALALVALAGIALAVIHLRETPVPAPVVRFQIPAPPKSTFNIYGMALSPDGTRLAFIAASPDGRPVLWLRPFDAAAAIPLPGTEGAAYVPFWSPDSRHIGFFVQGKLKKLEIGASTGGSLPQTLCELNSGVIVGASWNSSGTIIFGTPTGGLWQVSQAGGVPTQVTKPDIARGELAHMRPWFLPDGRHFLYITRDRSADNAIFVGSLDGAMHKFVTKSRQAGAYAPPAPGARFGHLIFLRDSILMAQPFDTARFELLGEPFPVAERVGWSLALGFFGVSQNGVIAFRSSSSLGNSRLVSFNRAGHALGTNGPPARYSAGLALSPTATHIAANQIDSTGNVDVWIIDITRGVPTRFTFDNALDESPVWAPDGTRLAFASERTGGGNLETSYVKDAGGAGAETLLSPGRIDSWSRDGRFLLYTLSDPLTRSDIWSLQLSPPGQKPQPYIRTNADERTAQFSPDGKWVAYATEEYSNQYQIFVQSFPPGGGRFQISSGGGVQPRWRRDGKELFYIAGDGRLMVVDVKTSPTFQAGTPQPLFDPAVLDGGAQAAYFRYDVYPDGQRFIFNSTYSSSEVGLPEPINVILNWNAVKP